VYAIGHEPCPMEFERNTINYGLFEQPGALNRTPAATICIQKYAR
jgi:hypothetical protein